jgi:tripartite-type tricarboxylate transporter receptor subunit TctC
LVAITRRSFFQGLAGIAGCPIAHRARAQSGYPAGLTVKFIVGFPAGGAQDIVGRVIADRLGALWKVPTVVENIAGAGGNLGMDRVAK